VAPAELALTAAAPPVLPAAAKPRCPHSRWRPPESGGCGEGTGREQPGEARLSPGEEEWRLVGSRGPAGLSGRPWNGGWGPGRVRREVRGCSGERQRGRARGGPRGLRVPRAVGLCAGRRVGAGRVPAGAVGQLWGRFRRIASLGRMKYSSSVCFPLRQNHLVLSQRIKECF